MRVHFIGIGGSGVSSLAKYLLLKGFFVSGSDILASAQVEELKKLGVVIVDKNESEFINNADVIVITSAIKSDNESLCLAKKGFV